MTGCCLSSLALAANCVESSADRLAINAPRSKMASRLLDGLPSLPRLSLPLHDRMLPLSAQPPSPQEADGLPLASLFVQHATAAVAARRQPALCFPSYSMALCSIGSHFTCIREHDKCRYLLLLAIWLTSDQAQRYYHSHANTSLID
jgi:hypothetical protein